MFNFTFRQKQDQSTGATAFKWSHVDHVSPASGDFRFSQRSRRSNTPFNFPVKPISADLKPFKVDLVQEVLQPDESEVDLTSSFAMANATTLTSRWWGMRGYVREILRFFIVSILIFLVLVVGLNYSAYREAFISWWQQQTGSAALIEKNMERLLATNQQSQVQLKNQLTKQVLSLAIPITAPDNRIVIPKIGKNVPVVEVPDRNLKSENWESLEKDIQYALKGGVIHYPGTAYPGQIGNYFVTGHSSYYPWDDGKYKDVFASLHAVEVGDSVQVVYGQKEYTYKITEKKVVKPTDVDVLAQTDDRRITLMTCTPVGTNLNRLILVGHLVTE